jgi:hypothetical protein
VHVKDTLLALLVASNFRLGIKFLPRGKMQQLIFSVAPLTNEEKSFMALATGIGDKRSVVA